MQTMALAMGVAAFACALDKSGSLDGATNRFYDIGARVLPAVPLPARILVVEISPDELQNPNSWLQVQQRLEQLEPELLVYSLMPTSVFPALLQANVDRADVLFGRRAETDIGRLGEIEPWPAQADQLSDQRVGLTVLPPASGGLHRSHFTRFNVYGAESLTIEALAARLTGATLPTGSQYELDFSRGLNYLPRVSAEQVLSGGLVPSLVKGRVVLIGAARGTAAPALRTPLGLGSTPVSQLEYQAFALDTLLNQRWLWELGGLLLMLILFPLNIVLAQMHHAYGVRRARWTVVVICAALLPLALALRLGIAMRLPVLTIMLDMVTTLAVYWWWSHLRAQHALERAVLETGRALARFRPQHFRDISNPWEALADMTAQLVPQVRSLFLERSYGTQGLQPVFATGYALSELGQRKFMLNDPLFTQALQRDATVPINEGLLPCAEEEEQYLVPILDGGTVFGFWVFIIRVAARESTTQFREILQEVAHSMGQLLHERQIWQLTAPKQTGAGLPASGAQSQLTETLQGAREQIDFYTRATGSLTTAVAVYDLFGRPTYVNPAAEQITRDSGIAMHSLNALELIASLTDRDQLDAYSIIQQVLVDRASFSLPVTLGEEQDEHYLLHLHPDLLTSEKAHASGLILELVGSIAPQYIARDELAVRASQPEAKSQAPSTPAPATKTAQPVNTIQATVEEVQGMVDKAQSLYGDSDWADRGAPYPVDVLGCVDRALVRVRGSLRPKSLTVNLMAPEGGEILVLADRHGLMMALSRMLVLLAEDAVQKSELSVAITPSADTGQLELELKNTGFGIPDHHLQNYLNGTGPAAAQDFRHLRGIRQNCERWRGSIEGSAAVGEGLRFLLGLRRVDPRPESAKKRAN